MEGESRRRRTRSRSGVPGVPGGVSMPGYARPAAPPHRSSAPASPASAASAASAARPAAVAETGPVFNTHAHPGTDDREGERGLRNLVGGGGTQVSVSAALRARDAARPTEEDLAAAERSVTVVHRGWTPRS